MGVSETTVYIMFNGAASTFNFDMDKESFMKKWNNQIPAVGYFTWEDESNNTVVINPSHCGTIEIMERRSF